MVGSRGQDRSTGWSALTRDLIWPKLVRCGAMSWRPSRLVLSYATCAAIALGWSAWPQGAGLAGRVGDAWSDSARNAALALAERDAELMGFAVERVQTDMMDAVGQADRLTWAILVVTLALVLATGGAISRSAAGQFALGLHLPWRDTLGWSARRLGQLAMALALWPGLAAALLTGAALVGWAGFAAGSWAGGVSFLLSLALSGGAVVLLAGWALGLPMFAPAVACEDTDGIDAAQRVVAYGLHRPLRLAWYLIVLLAMGVLMLAATTWLVGLALEFAVWASGLLSGQPDDLLVAAGKRSQTVGGSLIEFWVAAWRLIPAAVGFSYGWTAGPVLYLSLRQVCDGHDPADLWPDSGMGSSAEGAIARGAGSSESRSDPEVRASEPSAGAGQDVDA